MCFYALCVVTIHDAYSNCDIEVGPDSRQVPKSAMLMFRMLRGRNEKFVCS